jgi:hypothetical protein
MAEDDDLNVDDALRALRGALAVEPSDGFESAVRGRLAQRMPDRRSLRVPLLAAAAAALLALTFALVGREPGAPATAHLEPSPAPDTIAPLVPKPGPPATDTRVVRAVSRRPARTTAERALVPPDGMARLARYVASVRARPLDPEVLARDTFAALAEPPPIAIRAIEIAPLEISEGSFE